MAEVMKVYANLHSHTTHSDGVFTPEELVKVAHDEGYRAIACTDHDTFTGNAETRVAAEKYGLECIYGTEFSTECPELGCGFHITAFHFDPEEPRMKEYLWQLSEKESDQTKVLFERGLSLGLIKDITWDEVLEYNKGITWLCNEQVFRAMKAKGLIDDLGYPKFFDEVYGPHRSEVPEKYPFRHVKEVIEIIHGAGGIACVAHPHRQLHCIPTLVEWGLDGIEVWHSMLDIKERREALELAKKYDLYVSGGADHEGLCGGEYSRYEHPEETIFWVPPLTVGTTKYFYEEIRDAKKNPERQKEFDRMLADESIWVRAK